MADAKTAILLTLIHEGGFQSDPADRRNWSSGVIGVGRLLGTKYGITSQDLPNTDIKNLTPDQAVAYYTSNYWKQGYSQINSQRIANKLFDLGVLMGVGAAVRALQFVLNITTDGHFGSVSLSTLNAQTSAPVTEAKVLEEYKEQLKIHAEDIAAQNPTEAKFKQGWENRIAS